MSSINDAKNAINLNTLSSVTIKGDGAQRGSTMQPSPEGIYIYKDGSIKIVNASSDLKIVRQGGDGSWAGAKKDIHFGHGFTTSQEYATAEIVNHIIKNCDLDKVTITYE